MDEVVAVNELADLTNKLKISCFNFKVDFEKSYTSVNCFFLYYILSRFNFNDKWISWIITCVFLMIFLSSWLMVAQPIRNQYPKGIEARWS